MDDIGDVEEIKILLCHDWTCSGSGGVSCRNIYKDVKISIQLEIDGVTVICTKWIIHNQIPILQRSLYFYNKYESV